MKELKININIMNLYKDFKNIYIYYIILKKF